MGVCNGVRSTCAIAGYAMESRCHLGQKIVYDTVGQLGWSVGIRAHSISQVIEKVRAAFFVIYIRQLIFLIGARQAMDGSGRQD